LASQQALERAARIDLDTLELQADDLSRVAPKEITTEAKRRTDQVHFIAVLHLDYTASDLLRRANLWTGERAIQEAAQAYAISPNAPAARNHYVTHHWKKIEPQLEQWLRDAEGDASQQAAIGAHYRTKKDLDKAVEFLQRAKDLSPEISYIRSLAEAYKAKGQIDKWQSTLEELLQQPDYGLDHARVRVEIADYYISRHDYQTALPFAVQAASTGAEWALLAAGQCYEGLQRWNEAEAMYATASQGYGDFHWLCFTRRTGQGSGEEAKQAARESLRGRGGTKITLLVQYFVLRVIGDEKQALVALEESYRKTPDLAHGLHLVMFADERKDFARRDAVLAELRKIVAAEAEKAAPAGIAVLVEAFSSDIAVGGNAKFDLPALLVKREGGPSTDLNSFEFFLGKYLQLHGQPDAADEVWLKRMSRNHMNHFHRTLCGMELLKHGVGPEKYKAALQKIVDVGQPVDAPPK
jgi:tetratricopeptide (TPR) repeat protein